MAVSSLLAVGVLAPAAWFGARTLDAVEAKPALASARASSSSDIVQRDIQISTWKKALDMDPQSAMALGQLAGLYMQRARETGDDQNYVVAEGYARRSVGLRTNRNGATFVTLAGALLAQHRFVEADSIVTELVASEPDVPQYKSMYAEIKLELGQYETARSVFDSLHAQRTHLSIAPRLARWLELNGNPDGARKLLYDALSEAEKRRDLPIEQVAWFELRVGDIEMRNGRMNGARKALEAGLRTSPDDYRLLSAMARLEAVEGNPRKAIEFGERAMAIKLDPATLGIIGDAYAATRDSANAEEYFKTMEVAVAGQPGSYHRAWSLFLLDHDRRVPDVLKNVQDELVSRKDIYGYDLLAWALHKAGRDAEAARAMKSALKLGTRDAMLFYHAGMIERSLGNKATARAYLENALATNPHFHPTQPNEIRSVLKGMGS
ncbi:MAG TPA: tetratricopeptide repeat protein [Gemmatimonadaceae bacterium]|nr:tetratricopeptide repeat protein [Gemmatimonadaceae bacterium]